MELEAEESQGDTSDFWVTLNNMGFNKGLQLDEVTFCSKSRIYKQHTNIRVNFWLQTWLTTPAIYN